MKHIIAVGALLTATAIAHLMGYPAIGAAFAGAVLGFGLRGLIDGNPA